jgi:hypothetical protein
MNYVEQLKIKISEVKSKYLKETDNSGNYLENLSVKVDNLKVFTDKGSKEIIEFISELDIPENDKKLESELTEVFESEIAKIINDSYSLE